MKKVDPNDKEEMLRSASFDEVTWFDSTEYYTAACDNVKPNGWVRIHREVLAAAKINYHCVPAPTASRQNDGRNPPTLVKDDDTEEDEEKQEEVKPALEEDDAEDAEDDTEDAEDDAEDESSSDSSSGSSSGSSSNSSSSSSDSDNEAGP